MPQDGYKSVTIKEETFNKIDDNYKNHKVFWNERGINSISGIVMYLMEERIKEQKNLRKLAKQIEFVPQKFTKPLIDPECCIIGN